MSRTAAPRVLIENIHGVTVASLADAEILSGDVIEEIGEQLDELVEGLGDSKILLSFRDVRLMSSTMLGVVLKFARKVASRGGSLKLCCIAPDPMQAFRITRFDRLLDIYSNESTALDSFAGSA